MFNNFKNDAEVNNSSKASLVSLEPNLKNQDTIRYSEDVATESYITRFENIKSKTGARVGIDAFLADANSALVANVCNHLKNLDVNDADYEATKTSLKSQLPLYAYCGFNAANNRGEEFESNGNVIIDIDRIVDEDTLLNYKALIMKWNVATKGEKLLLVHRTPSHHGLRVVFRGDSQLSMVENQHQFAKEVGIPTDAIDKQVKDIKRISYAVPMDYIFFYHEFLFTDKGAELAAPSAETQPSTSSEVIINKINNIKRMTKNQSIEINKELIDNYFEKHHEERCVGNRHNSDGKFGGTLKYYGVPENQVTASYEYYISLYKNSGKFYSDDPSDTSEGIDVVLNNYLKNTTQASETEFVSTFTTECGVNNEVKVPYFDCNLEQIIEKHNDTAFIAEQIRGIHLPKSVWQTLQPIVNDNSRTMLTPAALFSTYTTASTYLYDVSYAFAEGSRREYIALNTLISAGFATGKSVLNDIVDLWSEHLRFQTKLFNAQHKEWKTKENARRRSLTDDTEAEAEPVNPTLFLNGGDLTAAGINRVLARSAGRRICLFTPEVDTINKSKGGRFGITSDMMRNFYDSTDIEVVRAGQNQNKVGENDADEIIKVPGKLNYIICGTPEAIAKYTPMADAENGTASRQILCAIPEVKFSTAPEDYPVEAIRAKGYINHISRLLNNMNGHVINNELIALKKEWDNHWTSYAKAADDVAVDKLKRRAQVLAYRIALNNHIIEQAEKEYTLQKGKWYKGKEEIPTPSISEDTKKLFVFSANYIMLQQVQRFGKIIREHSKNAISYDNYTVSITKGSAFDSLPNTFTYSDIREVYPNKNTAKNTIKRWKQKGLITKQGNVFYKVQ